MLDDRENKIEELEPVADTRVETVPVREKSEAFDAKTEIDTIKLEMGEREKFEKEEVERVEPMEFQMVESSTKVSIADVIDCKEKVANEVTIKEISTSKTKMEFGSPIPTRPKVWFKDGKNSTDNMNQTYATLHFLINPRVVKRKRSLLTTSKGCFVLHMVLL
ncbi:Hypothetical predicted protein [Olea europaea subsp. europaea]|uniref:Uncharacterized protein n=1 Tax=Olea europaea subsp. europaea TaxID=158383 RepID=A0A8S0TPH7_OLEEU|nr:Hypothetical predicted protein [Olea europaea subsp. europaea]